MTYLKRIFSATAFFIISTASFAGDWPSDVKEAIDVKQAAFCNLVESIKEKQKRQSSHKTK